MYAWGSVYMLVLFTVISVVPWCELSNDLKYSCQVCKLIGLFSFTSKCLTLSKVFQKDFGSFSFVFGN